MNHPTLSDKPWFRHPEPWLLLAAPMAAIVAGGFTWWIAATTNHSLVVDDYYKQGKAINQTLARDQRAADLGLRATLNADPARQTITLQLSSADDRITFPDALRLQLIHATRSELDHPVWLRRSADGAWRGSFAVPAEGRWQIQIDDGAGQWRLLKSVSGFAEPIVMTPDPSRAASTPGGIGGS